jgi:acyl-CoA dehydrogenase
MALAVSEPFAGSDVAALKTTARREGDYYIVNGTKKFITSGTKATYFTTAVRTGGEGHGGISLLLLEKYCFSLNFLFVATVFVNSFLSVLLLYRDMPGIKIQRMKTQGWWISGTALMAFDEVKVPVKNLIG